MKANEILSEADRTLKKRGLDYDNPEGERSMEKVVKMFNELKCTNLSAFDGWQFMEILKMVRSNQGEQKADNFIDGSAYSSLAGEAALAEKKSPRPEILSGWDLVNDHINDHINENPEIFNIVTNRDKIKLKDLKKLLDFYNKNKPDSKATKVFISQYQSSILSAETKENIESEGFSMYSDIDDKGGINKFCDLEVVVIDNIVPKPYFES